MEQTIGRHFGRSFKGHPYNSSALREARRKNFMGASEVEVESCFTCLVDARHRRESCSNAARLARAESR